MNKVTEEQIIDVKSIREKCIENIEILSKVKKLFLIPEMEVMTTKMVADYYEVDIETIQKCYQRNKEEIDSDGVVYKTFKDFLSGHLVPIKTMKGKSIFSINENVFFEIPSRGILCFSQRAVLRIGMLLRDSKIAKEIRTQLLNTFENSTEEQKTSSIDEEMILQANVGKAYMSGNIEEFAKASMEYNVYKNRYIIKLENENVELSKINKGLETENALLARKTMEWGNKPILNALIKKYALTCFNKSENKYPCAWNSLYRHVKYKYGYDIPNRHTAKNIIDRITDEEFPDVIATAVSLLKNNGIDVSKVINAINTDNINKLR